MNFDQETSNFLAELKEKARENYIPVVRDKTAERLGEVCHLRRPKKILEIGTAVGYSGLIMLKSCDGELVTIEKDTTRGEQAQENFSKAGVLSRVRLILDDAQKTIERLQEDGEKFDFVFLDGPKGQYKNYYPALKKLLKTSGILFCDNLNLLGFVKIEGQISHKHRSMVNHLREFVDMLKNDADFETEFYDIDDGFSISTLKK